MKPREPFWLEKIYDERRKRTVDLTTLAIAQIRVEKGRVSLAKIAAVSKQLDEQGKGISSSAILSNPEAYEIYIAARDWRQLKHIPGLVKRHPLDMQIKSVRDEKSLRARLHKLTKAELVDRLIHLEVSFSEMQRLLVGRKVDDVKKIIGEKGIGK